MKKFEPEKLLRTAVDALDLLADPENWTGTGKEQGTVLYGHFTAMEVAQRALKTIRGEDGRP